jgi:hypothetical protein
MDEETIEKMKKIVGLIDTIWNTINEWYKNKGLLELP